jgi:two-component system cell cycle response regulator
MLRPFNYEVLLAKSVDEALSLARRQHPDVIVSDVHLPARGGFDFYRTLKSEPELRSIPFIFLSSSVGDRERRTATALGADRFISRPIDPQVLLHAIQECLRARDKRRAGADEPDRPRTPQARTAASDATTCGHEDV